MTLRERLDHRPQHSGWEEARNAAILEASLDCIISMNHEGKIEEFNPAAEQTFGYRREDVIGRSLADVIIPPSLRKQHRDGVRRFLATGEGAVIGKRLELTGMRSDGNEFPVELTVTRVNVPGPPFFTGFIRDISQRKKLEDEIARRALYDSLTDLPNRVLFRNRLEHALAGALRDRLSLCLLMIDLNGFKAINDTFGHPVGDEVLIQTSRRIRSCLRPGDTAARLGGDEFAVLLDGAAIKDAVAVAERILEAVRKPVQVDQRELFIDASIGIGESPRGAVQAEAIIRDADAAMYAAKNQGKGGIETYRPELHNDVLKRFELVTDLRRALEREEFTLYYQPIVRLEDEHIRGVEALVRWIHPSRGLVPPGDFIPIAEQTGMLVHLDRWVMAEACRAVSAWQNEFPTDPPLTMSVNVSARQLQDPELTREVERSLRDTGLDPASLTLEITEGVLMQDSEATARILQELKDLGVRLAIDDFGIGFSSLSYLRRLPVDVVKIDRSFVAGVASVSEEWTLARGIVKLVHGLGFETVAEGVERADQKAHLRALGCRLAQGYYFARPMDEPALRQLLAEKVSRTA
jgi:diguanylate cyclase (GGDEF)-like protein/PAS domain S-box-containing protein